jgi:plasmid stability protein
MKQLTVRDVPDGIVQALRAEAGEVGQSMNAVARSALQEHVEQRRARMRLERLLPAMDELRARIAARAGGELEESVPLIRADRER